MRLRNFTFILVLLAAPLLGDNEFCKGYIYSKLEDHFGDVDISFDVKDHHVIIYDWPEGYSCEGIKNYLEKETCYTVEYNRSYEPYVCMQVETDCNKTLFEEGEFIPELNLFFPTLLAKPHIVGYSAGYRTYDKVFKTACLPVSIGDQFSLYQFNSVCYGNLYFGVEACVWAIFEGRASSLSLINADYYVALPLTYINDNFYAKLSFYHESSHLGDEFLLEHPQIVRENPSMEVAELYLAYEYDGLTPFFGYSRVLRCDEDFKVKRNSIFYGFNYYPEFLMVNWCNIQAVPFVATYFRNSENNNWNFDNYAAIGYEWKKSYGHKIRLYLEAHDGFSPEGQFVKERTQYLAIKLYYGY